MLKIGIVVFAAFVGQVFMHHCGNLKSCLNDVSSLEADSNKYLRYLYKQNEKNISAVNKLIRDKEALFGKHADYFPETCRSYKNGFQKKLMESCGILKLDEDPAIDEDIKYINTLQDGFEKEQNLDKKKEMCPHLVKYYNFICDRIRYDVDIYLTCDIDHQVKIVFYRPWKDCLESFNEL